VSLESKHPPVSALLAAPGHSRGPLEALPPQYRTRTGGLVRIVGALFLIVAVAALMRAGTLASDARPNPAPAPSSAPSPAQQWGPPPGPAGTATPVGFGAAPAPGALDRSTGSR
jgi:hypothetical protein